MTIISVSYKSVDYLNLNGAFLDRAGINVKWVVLDNTEGQTEEQDLIKTYGASSSSNFEWHQGVLDRGIKTKLGENADWDIWSGSHQHGLALNKGLDYVGETDYLLFLDPDFFIIPPLSAIIECMEENNYTFYGAPYHFSKSKLYGGFPAAFCMFINTKAIDIAKLDFYPGFGDFKTDLYPDVGYKVYEKYGGENCKVAVPTNGWADFPEIPPKYRLYNLDEKPFGIHPGMKIHNINEGKTRYNAILRFNLKMFVVMTKFNQIRERYYASI